MDGARVTESDVARTTYSLRIRDVGHVDASVVMYFHGTPGSRLDLGFGEADAIASGIRLVSFDRPGYGGSTSSSFSLTSVADDARAIADHLGTEEFATLGHSGGGPFALATAAALPKRVRRVGVSSGAGPFALVPGAIDQLDDGDRAALAHLPNDPLAAALGFAAGFEPLVDVFATGSDADIMNAFGALLSPRDRAIVQDAAIAGAIARSMRESLSHGVQGAGWDNVSWVGPWDFNVAAVNCPVLLWYGDDDRFAPIAHGLWLRDHLSKPQLTQRPGEGHFGICEHLDDMLAALVTGVA
jgi:pimeloyl-ACP methyl ester carboxylesterase